MATEDRQTSVAQPCRPGRDSRVGTRKVPYVRGFDERQRHMFPHVRIGGCTWSMGAAKRNREDVELIICLHLTVKAACRGNRCVLFTILPL